MARKKLPPEVRDFFVKMGKEGGLLGGRIRAERLTPEQRSESARKAVQARWSKAIAKETKGLAKRSTPTHGKAR
jgi:hypothetical protein